MTTEVCPSCEAGNHDHPAMVEANEPQPFKCACPCCLRNHYAALPPLLDSPHYRNAEVPARNVVRAAQSRQNSLWGHIHNLIEQTELSKLDA